MTDTCNCDGGVRFVTDVFARQEAGITQGADITPWQRAQPGTPEHEQYARYCAHRNSVYPCPSCRPAGYERWRNGCYESSHKSGSCRLCTPRKDAR